ncbi:MAG: hypothetical protein GY724_02530 [Actinomycetia bacterium]|nr:hypothetical protein [Actinomycetes bacterium]MCP3987923.1 hypothetical protein [Actinomycetes bacterium]MCP4087139.1 hypothetical protein [Actinomycetes bacterium]
MTVSKQPPRVALVLGSGGVLGGAFHAGVVKALLDSRGIDSRHVSTIVGTSAGSLTGALLGAGLHPNDIYRRETGQPLSPAGRRLLAAARAKLGPSPEQRSAFGFPVAPQMALRAMCEPWRLAVGSIVAGLMPRGTMSTQRIRLLVDGLVEGRTEGAWGWSGDPYLKVCAMDLESGRRTVFEGNDGETLGEAVAASCSVPGVYEPVMVNGREYLDGAAHSSDHVDVLRGHSFDLVVVSSPMSTERLHDVRSPWHPLRVATRFQTDLESGRLDDVGEVVVIRPTRDDLDAMGSNMLDRNRRAAVALQAYTTAIDRLAL